MGTPTTAAERRVLVIGAGGALGSLLVRAFDGAGWTVCAGSRHPEGPGSSLVDLDEPRTVTAALGGADLVVNTVPDGRLTAERAVLERGGRLINVSALPAEPGRRLAAATRGARGTVVTNAGIAPGITNLVAADLLRHHPEADEIELVFTVSTKSTAGRAGGDFAHRNLVTGRHRTKVVPLPEPFGRRRCLGFAEDDRGWLGPSAADRRVSPFVCIRERAVQRALLALNATGMVRRIPRRAFKPVPARDGVASEEAVRHWVAVRAGGEQLAARTLECRGDYESAARSTVVLAGALTGRPVPAGVSGPEEVVTLDDLMPALRAAGIVVVDRDADGRALTPEPTRKPTGAPR